MAKRNTQHRRLSWTPQLLALSVLSIAVSFGAGIRTSGNVETISSLSAEDTRITSDIDADGDVDVMDAVEILEIVRGYEPATPDQLMADPNGDGRLTIDDALRILHDLSAQ